MINKQKIEPDNQIEKSGEAVGEMHKRREIMADERRYILYYTFGENAQMTETKSVKSENV